MNEILTVEEWESLRKSNNEKYGEMYKKFMYCEENSHCCDCCPANNGFSSLSAG